MLHPILFLGKLAVGEEDPSNLLANTVFLVLAIAAAIWLIWLVLQTRKTVGLLTEEGRQTEEEFARTMEEVARLSEESKEERASHAVAVPTVVDQEAPIEQEEAGCSGPEELARRLQSLRILTDFEGRVPLPIPPEGLIYGLRKGGSCLILERLESARMMNYFCRRFDMVVVVDGGGEPMILERLQHRIPDLIDTPGMSNRSS